jgi:hypothetical protein
MSLTRSITSIITDGCGFATKEFLSTTAERWADEHLALRYRQTHLASDGVDHFSHLCWQYLCEEYKALRSWFQDDGKISLLLQSKFLTTRLTGPLGNGIGWDFKPNGDPEPRMLLFKGTLISAQRSAELLPKESRNSGNMQVGGIVKIVRSAFTARAEVHSWRANTVVEEGKEKVLYSGADMSRRWVSFRTYTFLVNVGADPVWAWEASRCKALFGPIDEDRNAY